jgi:hypothetical protein
LLDTLEDELALVEAAGVELEALADAELEEAAAELEAFIAHILPLNKARAMAAVINLNEP